MNKLNAGNEKQILLFINCLKKSFVKKTGVFNEIM